MAPKHPGKTPSQRRALDAIGCGNFSPPMSKATKDALLREGLIVPIGHRTIGYGAFSVRVEEYEMPIPVHMDWCSAVSAEADAEGAAE